MRIYPLTEVLSYELYEQGSYKHEVTPLEKINTEDSIVHADNRHDACCASQNGLCTLGCSKIHFHHGIGRRSAAEAQNTLLSDMRMSLPTTSAHQRCCLQKLDFC